MRIAICDDDETIFQKMEAILADYMGERTEYTIRCFETSEKLLSYCQENEVDIVFMDIELAEESGIETAKKLLERRPDCQVIYHTNYLHYAVDVYETEHCYYILKEQLRERIPDVMRKAEEKMRLRCSHLAVASRSESQIIGIAAICYIERQRRISVIHTQTGHMETYEKLEDLHRRLPADLFVRCHNSYIVNLSHVKKYTRMVMILEDDTEIPISRPKIEESRIAFLRWAKQQM